MLTQKQLDAALFRFAEDEAEVGEPFDPLEMRAVKNSLYAGYKDPKNAIINDAYIWDTYSQGLFGTPDRLKQAFGFPNPEYTPHVMKVHNFDGVSQKVNEVVNTTKPMFGGNPEHVTKDVLGTAITGSTGGGVLVNQQVIPQLYTWFYDEFQAMSRIQRVQASGLDHEWNNIIALSDENEGFLDENGCPINAASVYFRGRTNIALVGVSRGTNLKLDLAIRAGGTLYNGGMSSYDLEMKAATTVRARLLEKAFFQGVTAPNHGVNGGSQVWDEYGQSYVNGFNGWRVLTSGHANQIHSEFYPNPYLPLIFEQDMAGPGTISDAVDKAAVAIRNRGGKPTAVYCSFDVARRLRGEVTQFIRYTENDAVNGMGIVVGAHVQAIDTAAGLLPIIACPDDSLGKYPVASIGTPTINGVTLPATNLSSTYCQDLYVASEGDLSLPYLGSQDPIPFEIPIGIGDMDGNGCFVRRFIIYLFMGFGMHVPVHQAKVRVPAV